MRHRALFQGTQRATIRLVKFSSGAGAGALGLVSRRPDSTAASSLYTRRPLERGDSSHYLLAGSAAR